MPWIAAGAAVGSAAIGALSANSASKKQEKAAKDALRLQQQQYNDSQDNAAPWLNAGTQSIDTLSKLMGLGGADPAQGMLARYGNRIPVSAFNEISQLYGDNAPKVMAALQAAANDVGGPGLASLYNGGTEMGVEKISDVLKSFGNPNAMADPLKSPLLRSFTMADRDADPVYQSGLQFGLDQGTNAINARATALGQYDSGATLKALTRFGNDYGSTKAGDAYNRFVANQGNIYGKLSGTAGTGQTATQQVQNAGTNYANQGTDLITGAGNARAAGIVGAGNAWGGALQNAANTYSSNQILDKILNRGGINGGNYNYNSAGTFQPYYTGYGAGGDSQYG